MKENRLSQILSGIRVLKVDDSASFALVHQAALVKWIEDGTTTAALPYIPSTGFEQGLGESRPLLHSHLLYSDYHYSLDAIMMETKKNKSHVMSVEVTKFCERILQMGFPSWTS